MTTVTTLAQSLSAHPGPWNGGYGWYPFFPFVPIFGFFFFAFILFLVFGVFGRRRGWGPPQHRDAVQSAESDSPGASRRGRSTRRSTATDLDAAPPRPGLDPGHPGGSATGWASQT